MRDLYYGVHNGMRRFKHWQIVGVCALLVGMLAFLPATAQAATTGWGPRLFGNGSVFPGFWVTGEVSSVEEDSVVVDLPNPSKARGFMRHINLQVKLAVDDNSLLLNSDLEPIALSDIAVGDSIVVAPRLVWGNLVTRLLYVGDPEDLEEAAYRGEVVTDAGDTLTLKNRHDGDFTVVIDDATVWYDEGQMERPAELPEGMQLRVLGVMEESGENDAGEDVIRAILITPSR